MKTIDYESWIKKNGKTRARAEFILSHFDTSRLQRRKAPARARRKP